MYLEWEQYYSYTHQIKVHEKSLLNQHNELTFIYAYEFHENFALCTETFDTYMVRIMGYELDFF